MSQTFRLVTNAATNYFRFLVVMSTQFLLTPLLLRGVGAEDFGIWSLTFSVMGFLGLVDGGLATSVVKYVAECRGTGDVARRDRLVSTLFVLYMILAVVAVVLVAGLSLGYTTLFHIPPARHGTALALLWILALRSVILALPLSLFYGILFGEQRIYLLNVVQTVTTLAYAGAMALALSRGTGIVTVAWINLGAMLLEYVSYVVLVFRLLPGIRIRVALADRSLLREVASFSLSQLLVNTATLVRMRTDPLLVQWFMTLPAVAVYAIALRISESTLLLTKQLINIFSPLVAQIQGSGDVVKLRFVLLNATKFVFAASTVLTISVCALAREMILLWVGPEMSSAAMPLRILTVAMGLTVPQMMAANILVMTGHHKLSARAQGMGILINLSVSALLAPLFGLNGIALGTLVATVCTDLLYILPRACALQNVPFSQYLRQVFAPQLVCGGAQVLVILWLKTVVPPTNLVSIALLALSGGLTFAVLFAMLFVETDERALVRETFRKHKTKALPTRRSETGA